MNILNFSKVDNRIIDGIKKMDKHLEDNAIFGNFQYKIESLEEPKKTI